MQQRRRVVLSMADGAGLVQLVVLWWMLLELWRGCLVGRTFAGDKRDSIRGKLE
jgi:hypothetical protein